MRVVSLFFAVRYVYYGLGVRISIDCDGEIRSLLKVNANIVKDLVIFCANVEGGHQVFNY